MARDNLAHERWAVSRSGLAPGDHAVLVGHGPGVGLVLAAERVRPGGRVIGVEPSPLMRKMAGRRVARRARDVVEIRHGTAEDTGCASASMAAAISVNNVTLWDRPAGFAELMRVLRPGGQLVLIAHQRILGDLVDVLPGEAEEAGFTDVVVSSDVPSTKAGPATGMVAGKPAQ
ncbi:class I SAM-dependent methyltransferase [Amycolatopsis sp. YIM 10]|uniref:class I SAM-dependent methyltransferase n=1 Tax=Amycolatopsis sp. YIM 10 TaxID=2653857 RepID=UPI0012AA2434|nr:class I SAM-dependent methyltransferase [Amycolatopsis sp. YIM 10]QFU90569.1 hypothetical protein YIM_26975 [Amycolatopsis sp. YIM 10]